MLHALSTCLSGLQKLNKQNGQVISSSLLNAMQGLDDGGAIYVGGHSEVNMNQQIIDNVVTNARGNIGIYLDDSANGITVSRNIVTDCVINILMHNAYNISILDNKFIGNSDVVVTHIKFAQGGTPSGHVVTGNEVISNGPNSQVYNLEGGSSHTTLGSFNYNTYRVKPTAVFARTWDGSTAANRSFSDWQAYMSDDYQSVFIPL